MSSSPSTIPQKAELKFPTRQDFHDSCHPQTMLPLRKPLIDFILKTKKSFKFYQKLIKCCKLFFAKNPILYLPHFIFNWRNSEWQFCLHGCLFRCDHEKKFDLSKVQCKVWLFGFLIILQADKNKIQRLVEKIYQCDAHSLGFQNIHLSLNDLKRLTSSTVKKTRQRRFMTINNISVTDENGEEISLENLLEYFSPAFKLYLRKVVGNNFVNDYNKLVNICHKIRYCHLNDLRNDFDGNKFYNLLTKTNCLSTVHYSTENFNDIFNYDYLETSNDECMSDESENENPSDKEA